MGISKTEEFSSDQNQMALIFKALGHPARIAIIEYLQKVDTCICGDIVNELPLAQATVSQHLRELKNVGLIKGNIEGNAICYCIADDAMKHIQQYFAAINLLLSQKKNLCC